MLKPSWYIKEQSPRRKLKITNVKYFFLYFPKMGNAVFNINNSKTIFLYFFILSFKKNLRIHSHLLQASKRFEICFFSGWFLGKRQNFLKPFDKLLSNIRIYDFGIGVLQQFSTTWKVLKHFFQNQSTLLYTVVGMTPQESDSARGRTP